jgi:hypothetical protein
MSGPPTKTPQGIYLGKEGKVFGPFSAEDINQLKFSGEYFKYSWIWDGSSPNWVPVNAPPPPPAGGAPAPTRQDNVDAAMDAEDAEEEALEHHQMLQPAAAAPSPAPQKAAGIRLGIHAICHNQLTLVSGKIRAVSASSAVLIGETHQEEMPPFRKGNKVWLNLLDDATGKGENVEAVIEDFKRDAGRWEFLMRWKRIPQILG